MGCSGDSGLPQRAQLFVVARDAAQVRQLTHDDRFHDAPAWSPNGRSLVSASSGVRPIKGGGFASTPGVVQVVAADGTGVRELRAGGSPSTVAWPAADRIALLSRADAPADTPAALVVLSARGRLLQRASLELVAEGAAWSPDGRRLAFARGRMLLIADRNGHVERRLRAARRIEGPVAWSPGGHALLFVSGGRVWRVASDRGAPRSLVSGLIIAVAGWSASGRDIVIGAVTERGDRRFHLYRMPAGGGRLRRLTGEVATGPAAWSPDGRRIAYVVRDRDAIETITPDGGARHVVARMPGAEIHHLTWSPDGDRLAFTTAKRPPAG